MAKTLLSSTAQELAQLLCEVKERFERLNIPIVAVVSDGQLSIRNAVELALPEGCMGYVTFTISNKRLSQFMRQTAMPRRN